MLLLFFFFILYANYTCIFFFYYLIKTGIIIAQSMLLARHQLEHTNDELRLFEELTYAYACAKGSSCYIKHLVNESTWTVCICIVGYYRLLLSLWSLLLLISIIRQSWIASSYLRMDSLISIAIPVLCWGHCGLSFITNASFHWCLITDVVVLQKVSSRPLRDEKYTVNTT